VSKRHIPAAIWPATSTNKSCGIGMGKILSFGILGLVVVDSSLCSAFREVMNNAPKRSSKEDETFLRASILVAILNSPTIRLKIENKLMYIFI
jgi:hypothetical protein